LNFKVIGQDHIVFFANMSWYCGNPRTVQ